MQIDAQLSDGLQRLGLNLSVEQQGLLIAYLELLQKWNKHYNLTAIRDLSGMVTAHLLDSLAIIPFLHGKTMLDVGTGAGLPGIPLAIACPERLFTLLDSNSKKTRFVSQAKMSLCLGNIEIVTARIEEYHPRSGFDTVISRAFTDLTEMLARVRQTCTKDGKILAMKGRHPEGELQALPSNITVDAIHRLEVPFLNAERHLISMSL